MNFESKMVNFGLTGKDILLCLSLDDGLPASCVESYEPSPEIHDRKTTEARTTTSSGPLLLSQFQFRRK